MLETTSTGHPREPVPPSEQIQVVVLSGRPAVGKTKIKNLLMAQMPREPAVISGDDIGTRDPRVAERCRRTNSTFNVELHASAAAFGCPMLPP